jgi:hypothetical protein
VHKVLVELGLVDGLVVVPINVLVDRDTKLLSERLKDVGKVGSLGLWRDTLTDGTVSGETRLDVQRRLDQPVAVVLLDGGLDGTLEPWLEGVSVLVLIVDLNSEIGEEWGLGSAEILLVS